MKKSSKSIRSFRLLVLVYICVSLVQVALAGWAIEVVDSTDRVGSYCSIAMNSQDKPSIAYYNQTDSALYYARRVGIAWGLDRVDPSSSRGKFCSLAIDSTDNPGITHYNEYHEYLMYSYFDGVTWTTEIADDSANVGSYSSLQFDSADRPHVSYTNYSINDLSYTYKYAGSWHSESLGVGGYVTDIALSPIGGYPHICSMWPLTYNMSYMYYRYKTPSGWMSETIEVLENGGLGAQISLDESGNPMIATWDGVTGGLYFLRRTTGGVWLTEIVDAGPYISGSISMVVDSNFYPHITYYDGGFGRLMYARWDGSQWLIDVVDDAGVMGEASSIALDSNDNPHIAYYDSGRKDLCYAYQVSGSIWFDLDMPDIDLRPGDDFILAAIGGNPSSATIIVDEYILLDAFGAYYFYPTWGTALAFDTMTLNPGQGIDHTVFDFIWPPGVGSASGLYFYGALFTNGTFDLIAMDSVEWSFGS